jgi:antitoxin component of MazEF toxin-antitoxin module
MLVDTMDAQVRKWGNSFAIRVPKSEMERLGLHEGDHVEVSMRKAATRARKKKVDLSHWPTFRDPARDVSERHDEYLYGARRRTR